MKTDFDINVIREELEYIHSPDLLSFSREVNEALKSPAKWRLHGVPQWDGKDWVQFIVRLKNR